ncbi:hypothetical protein GOBAR_AA33935 [Gossypium barbadense]|uniref:Uncharacterized protein n=1 Tax=Gossypium barbadense TaxID=3634 RepID=A0A2P5W6M2_GOSBA|nr:hypothetical protein GOBAR_AA33935 [Gossypium barbadense]
MDLGAEKSGLQEIGFKQGYFTKKIKSNRPGSSSGLSIEGNKGKGILGQSVIVGPAKQTSGLAHLSVEQELLDLGHDLARDRLVLRKDVGSKSNGVQLILTAKQNMENLESMERTVQMSPKIVFQNKHSSLHFNPTFEGSLELLVHVNPKFLDFDQYLAVIFKEHSEYNSKATVVNEGLRAFNNLNVLSRGHGLDNKKKSRRNGRTLNKIIRGSRRRFKIVKSSRVSLPDTMNFMAKLIGEQVETFTDKATANEWGVEDSVTL